MQLVFDFSQWLISPRQGVVGRQYDNLSHSLAVEGELPSGYTWDMLVEAKGKYNIIPLSATATGATASLTADQLAFGDTYYAFQLRGTSGEIIHHTNAVQVYVPDTIVGPGTWPVLPTEFSQAEANIKELNAHPPVPGEMAIGCCGIWTPTATCKASWWCLAFTSRLGRRPPGSQVHPPASPARGLRTR